MLPDSHRMPAGPAVDPTADLPLLRASLADVPIVRRGDYHYFVHPLSDGVPAIAPALLDEVTGALAARLPTGVAALATAEAMGLPLGAALALRRGLPLVVLRKRGYGLPGEVEVAQATGYSRNTLYLNADVAGRRVAVVDDVLSTGGTLRATVAALRRAGAEVARVAVVFAKDDPAPLAAELGVEIDVLLRVTVVDGRVEVLT